MKIRVSARTLSVLLTMRVLFWSSFNPASIDSVPAGLGVTPEPSGKQVEQVESVSRNRRQLSKRSTGRQLEQEDLVKVLPGTTKRWALIIGVHQYEDGGISDRHSDS